MKTSESNNQGLSENPDAGTWFSSMVVRIIEHGVDIFYLAQPYARRVRDKLREPGQ